MEERAGKSVEDKEIRIKVECGHRDRVESINQGINRTTRLPEARGREKGKIIRESYQLFETFCVEDYRCH
jgi:hypothetical protein